MNGVKTNLMGRDVCLSKTCSVTHEEYSIIVSFPKYVMWKEKKNLVQDVFPELNADEREFLISGWTPAEWTEMMAHER
jgi:hypothetical protein